MKKVLLMVAVIMGIGCSSSDKKPGAPADGKQAAKPATAANVKAAPGAKGAQPPKFEDEDISKAKPGAVTMGSESSVTCKGSADDTRTIAVEKADGIACRVNYTKNGSTQTVATANADFSYCEQKRDQIKNNLEGAGFKCE